MPFSGGYSPQPERTGGGDAGGPAPLLQRIVEALAKARGRTYDQTLQSAVGAENMAYARAIAYDAYGSNIRFANEMNPATATVGGMLPRWEVILAAPPLPGDTQPTRQARCMAKLLRFGYGNNNQLVSDAVAAVLGPLFVTMTYIRPDQATVWWPGYGGGNNFPNPPCEITGVAGNLVTVANLTNVPKNAAGTNLTLVNTNDPNNTGVFPVQTRISDTSVVVVNTGFPSAPDYGAGGGTIGSPTIGWRMRNPLTPFTSSVAHVLVSVNPTAVPGYVNNDGTLAAKFYKTLNQMNPVLDWLLPADVTYDWYVGNSHTHGVGFYLDDPNNLDCELFD